VQPRDNINSRQNHSSESFAQSFSLTGRGRRSLFYRPWESLASPFEDKPSRRQDEQRQRNHHDYETDNTQENSRPEVYSVSERGLEVVKKSSRRGRNHRSGRVQRDFDGRKG
jgi:hypothetical protein